MSSTDAYMLTSSVYISITYPLRMNMRDSANNKKTAKNELCVYFWVCSVKHIGSNLLEALLCFCLGCVSSSRLKLWGICTNVPYVVLLEILGQNDISIIVKYSRIPYNQDFLISVIHFVLFCFLSLVIKRQRASTAGILRQKDMSTQSSFHNITNIFMRTNQAITKFRIQCYHWLIIVCWPNDWEGVWGWIYHCLACCQENTF